MSSRIELSYPQLAPAQRAAVIEELNRILADPLFKSSKRCVALLSHLVEHALQGDHERLKERILCIEVFGRDANFDSNADPIVRMTANEIRKRLAQYYQEEDRHQAVKIRLVRGTYSPEFEFSQLDHSDSDEAETSEGIPNSIALPDADTPLLGRIQVSPRYAIERDWSLWVGIAIVAIAAGFAFYHYTFARSVQYLFWEPLLDSIEPLRVCIADDPSLQHMGNREQAKLIASVIASRKLPAAATAFNPMPMSSYYEADMANRVTSWLATRGKQTALAGSARVMVHELRQGPLVLIGGFHNAWSMVLLSNLRFRIRIDPSTLDEWIEDAQNPSQREWSNNAGQDRDVDYALITRYLDPETANWIVAISSLGPYGDRAATLLITTDSLAKSLPAGISSKGNLQIVLKATVIQGSVNAPQVLSVYTW